MKIGVLRSGFWFILECTTNAPSGLCTEDILECCSVPPFLGPSAVPRMVPQALKWRMGTGQRLTEDSPKQDLLRSHV